MRGELIRGGGPKSIIWRTDVIPVWPQGILDNIIFNANVETAAFDSSDNRWHLVTGEGLKYSCDMLFGCTGYFSYENPYEPKFPRQENFPGPIVHPQKWQPGSQFNRIDN